MKNYLQVSDVINKEVLGFKSSTCKVSGCVIWESPEQDEILWATPNWENEKGETPFDMEGENIVTLQFEQIDGNLDLQLDIYLGTVQGILTNLINNN